MRRGASERISLKGTADERSEDTHIAGTCDVWNHAHHGETPAASVTTQAHGDEGDANNHAC